MKFKHYYEKLFGINLYGYRGSRKEYINLIKKEFKQKAAEKNSNIKGSFEVYKKDNIWIGVIWLRKHDFGVLVHESLHAVHWALYDKGLTLTDSSEETYAYLLQSLVEKMK